MAFKVTSEVKSMMQAQRAEFHPLLSDIPFTREANVHGIILPDNTHLMELRPVSPAVLNIYQQEMEAGFFYVKGTWTFTPDVNAVWGVREFRKSRS